MIVTCPDCGEQVKDVGLVMAFDLDGQVHVHWDNWTFVQVS